MYEVLLKLKVAAPVLEVCSINMSKNYYLNKTGNGRGDRHREK